MAANLGLAICGFADVMLFSNEICDLSDHKNYLDNVYLLPRMQISEQEFIDRHYRQSRQLSDR